MVKVDIVRAIQLETGLQFGEAEQLVNELLEIMKQTLENGEDVLITGLGKFHPSKVWRDEINGKV